MSTDRGGPARRILIREHVPAQWTATTGDSGIYPGAQEIADDGIDQNCDGLDATIWYRDYDGDGYGLTSEYFANEQPWVEGYYTASVGGDCAEDDIDTGFEVINGADINPGAPEIEGNTVDENCDGFDLKTWYMDGSDRLHRNRRAARNGRR